MRLPISIFISALSFTACCDRCACEEGHESNFNESGSIRIEKIHIEEMNHGRQTLYGKHSTMPNPLPFMAFGISGISGVEVGDSIYKEKGTYTYILVKKDSCYALLLDCDTAVYRGAPQSNISPPVRWALEQIILVKAWKSGDSVNMKEIIR